MIGDEELMKYALNYASAGLSYGDLPIGCAISVNGMVIGFGHNRNKRSRIEHAEMIALKLAFSDGLLKYCGTDGVVLATTLEPCIMCYSAAIISGISRIVYGLRDPFASGPDHVRMIAKHDARLPIVTGGVLVDEASTLLRKWLTSNPDDSRCEFVTQLVERNAE